MNLFSGFTDSDLKEVVSPLFGVNYWIGLSISVCLIASLFIFKGFYAQVSRYNVFRYSLGSLQLILYFLYFYFHEMNGDINWKDYMPFHLCSLLDLVSIFLLICPSDKLFSLTFPLVGPVVLPFLFPDKHVYGPDNFFYYHYYLNHLIIFFGFFYLYTYGHVKFNSLYLRQICTFMTGFALFVFVFNITFGTNYLFIGSAGFTFTDKYWLLSTGHWNPVFRFIFMWSVGMMFILIFNFLIKKYFPPFYFNSGSEVNKYYDNKLSLFSKIKNRLKKTNKLGA
ncbi:YwaF family protein [Spiroplasma platyhelix]|uniref:YwaF family protein n=1 Tax=Spiroplasma platyhelix PALS-1 TaxID=1276218 RepID=A0A846TXD6_9MOLU|nr:YwaF family protein [Spiroplasma platyhelix]MBE4704359.1 hypothetical protein [Spiroplasma platyhelix PALS-1]NKE38731.1 YwaF family protein [Spiroplasma platyhelix PALS-1]UJB28942.1 hypothetical protein SPLAT_v1c01770 [Spiroplasma platyhelix PALS-1]